MILAHNSIDKSVEPEVDMKTLVVYDTKFGNTEHVAKLIAGQFGEHGSVHVVNAEGDVPSIDEFDLLVIGGPTHAHGMSTAMRQLLESWPQGHLSEIGVAVFDTRLRLPVALSGSAASSIASRLKKKYARLVLSPESFFVSRNGHLLEGEEARSIAWATGIEVAMTGVETNRVVVH
jgi:flavodoxin